MRFVAIAALLGACLGGEIDRDVKDGLEWLPDGLFRFPAGECLAGVVDHDDLALDIGGDNAVADGTEGDGEAFLLRGDFGLETLPLGHIAHHGDVEPIAVHDHFAEGNFDRESGLTAGAPTAMAVPPVRLREIIPTRSGREWRRARAS